MFQSRLTTIAVALGVVVLLLFSVVQYTKNAERDRIQNELQKEVDDTKEVIRNEIKNNKPADRNDASDSLRYFQDRN